MSKSHLILKDIIDLCMRNYGNVYDSDGNIAGFIEESVKLYSRIMGVKRRMDNKTENP